MDLYHEGAPARIGCWIVDGVLIDPGPSTTLPALRAAIGSDEPSAILLTHIHFDHAGAVGSLVGLWPDVPVFVHRSAVRHLTDPSRLLASATRVWGEAGMAVWGEMAAVPVRNLRPLDGGERVLDAFAVEYTPGHASHHIAFLHERSRIAFVGDVAGIRVPPATAVMAPAPPPDIHIERWLQSLEALRRWRPQALALTHFGLVEDVDAHLDRMKRALAAEVAQAEAGGAADFATWARRWLTREAGASVAEHYLGISPAELTWHGLDRWLGRK